MVMWFSFAAMASLMFYAMCIVFKLVGYCFYFSFVVMWWSLKTTLQIVIGLINWIIETLIYVINPV